MEKPKIRFLKNKHSWVRNTFEEIAKRRTKSSDNPDLPRIEYQDIVSGEGRLNKDLNKNTDFRKGIVFETNDILYGKLRPYLKNWLHPNFNGIALGDFWVLQARNCDSKFLFSLVQSPKFQRVANDTSGTKMPRSDWKTVSQTEFSIPTSNEEQSAIGSLFRTLDDLLASYKDNLANYQSLKATMLSKMFPKAGQTVPEIRLDGFDGEWEVQTLKELASFSKGNGYTKNDLVNSGKEIILYGRLYTNYQTVISKVNTFVTTVKANTVISKGGEVVVPASGESAEDISRASVVEKSGVILGGDLNIIYPDENKVGSIFLALTISNGSQQKELIKRAQGKSVVHLRNNDLEKVVLHYPSTEEQRAIGSYFTNLDNLINSHQEKISQLETLKKKLLQDMFI
ncbi:Type I restriction modification DNA specificity domain protein [Streptococcus parasanguinis]|uniref:Type I restriction modification DNA specificity domain protein n=1 Tax=Streptococcus parasanguinis TaxID=1318 RepID=A0A6N2YFQ9_STRPA